MTTNEITQVYNVFRQLDFDGNDIHRTVWVMRTVFGLNPIHRDGKLWRLDDYLNKYYGEITEYLLGNPYKPILRKLVGLIQRYNEWITRDAAPHPSVIIKAYVTLPDYIKAHPYGKDTANEIEAFCRSFNEITFGQNLNLWLDMILEQLQDDTTPLPASTGDTDRQPQPLPDPLNTGLAPMVFPKAIERGWMKKTTGGAKWLGTDGNASKAQLAYFCGRAYGYELNSKVNGNAGGHVPYEALQRYFNVTRLDRSLKQCYEAKKEQPWRKIIDSIF